MPSQDHEIRIDGLEFDGRRLSFWLKGSAVPKPVHLAVNMPQHGACCGEHRETYG